MGSAPMRSLGSAITRTACSAPKTPKTPSPCAPITPTASAPQTPVAALASSCLDFKPEERLLLRAPTGRGREPQTGCRAEGGGKNDMPMLMGNMRPNGPRQRERHAHFDDDDDAELLAMNTRHAVLARMRH